jgi:hypothetical protein
MSDQLISKSTTFDSMFVRENNGWGKGEKKISKHSSNSRTET